MWCYRNSEPISHIAWSDRAVQYGDGCFSTVRMCENVWQLKNRHIARLQQAMQGLKLQADLQHVQHSLQLLQQHCQNTGSGLNGVLKILISRGEGARGYAMPDHAADVYVCFYPQQNQSQQNQPRNTASSLYSEIESGLLQQQLGISMPQLVGLKTLNRLEQVLLKNEAQQQQWSEALVCDVQQRVVEGVSSNCFILLPQGWVTPDLAYNGIWGVMRAEILARMQQNGISCEVREVYVHELNHMQALFYCNALQPMQAVSHFHGRVLDVALTQQLYQTLDLDHIDE